MNLTQAQYGFILGLLQTLPGAFALDEEDDESFSPTLSRSETPVAGAERKGQETPQIVEVVDEGTVDLLPELPDRVRKTNGEVVRLWTKMEVAFEIKTVIMELFDGAASTAEDLHQHSLARFQLHRAELRYKALSNDAMEAEVLLRSFTIRDTHPSRQTKFRDIVPAAKHDGHQFMLSYTQTGGPTRSAIANLTIDTPTFIFTLEPLFALASFFTSGFVKDSEEAPPQTVEQQPSQEAPAASTLAYRVNIVAATVMLLADPSRADSEAVVLSIGQVLVSQQTALL
jgi:vacuolar protein sorting-associated protein 13A/C